MSDSVIEYGSHPAQVADLTLPENVDGVPLRIRMHRGFWRARLDRHSLEVVAEHLVASTKVVCERAR